MTPGRHRGGSGEAGDAGGGGKCKFGEKPRHPIEKPGSGMGNHTFVPLNIGGGHPGGSRVCGKKEPGNQGKGKNTAG